MKRKKVQGKTGSGLGRCVVACILAAGILIPNMGCMTFMAATGLDDGKNGETLSSVALPGNLFGSIAIGAAVYDDPDEPDDEILGGFIGLVASPILIWLDRTIVVWFFGKRSTGKISYSCPIDRSAGRGAHRLGC